MKVVVTGASGFIGRNVLLRAPREWTVYATYHSTADLPEFVQAEGLANVQAIRCNLLDVADVRTLARTIGSRPDAMLYLAANGDPATRATSCIVPVTASR